MKFSEELRQYIKRRGLKPKYICDQAGMSHYMFYRYLNPDNPEPARYIREGLILFLDTIGLPNG